MRPGYLTGARELEGKIDAKQMLPFCQSTMLGVVVPSDPIFIAWRYVLDADKAGTTNLKLQFSITDIKETWILEMRKSILEIKQGQLNDTSPVLEMTVAQLNAMINRYL